MSFMSDLKLEGRVYSVFQHWPGLHTQNFTDALSSMQVIYVMRNPKDVFTSSFHFYGMASFLVQPGSQSEFLQKFLDGKGSCPC